MTMDKRKTLDGRLPDGTGRHPVYFIDTGQYRIDTRWVNIDSKGEAWYDDGMHACPWFGYASYNNAIDQLNAAIDRQIERLRLRQKAWESEKVGVS